MRQAQRLCSVPFCVSCCVFRFPSPEPGATTPQHTHKDTTRSVASSTTGSPTTVRCGADRAHLPELSPWCSISSDRSFVPLAPSSLICINFGIYYLVTSTSTNLCVAGSCGRDPSGCVISVSVLPLNLLVTQWGFYCSC